ncbi:lysostaphin resistance A-like protein [Polaribacter sp. R77954]|uniref:lysostaphin resistance A-like protein n=1 Tax=Polaribacter sp. R77954 TaxID=3093870 RepID=UPI0037CBD407
MKPIIQKFPIISKFILALLLFAFSLFISGLINKGFVKQYFPYSATICLLIATYILFKTDNKSLSSIGLNFQIKNLKFLPLGLFIGAFAFLIAKWLRAIYLGETFNISSEINYQFIIYGFYTMLPMVAVEEFLFRGYLFKKTVEISSVVKANIIFGILFLSVHVFDNEVINSLPKIIFTVITIPIGHLLFSVALLKSKSLFFPIGIHLGNNWASQHLITTNNNSNSLLFISDVGTFETWTSFILFIVLWNSFFLFVIFIIWKWNNPPLLIRKKR